jgi:hypothetical protein
MSYEFSLFEGAESFPVKSTMAFLILSVQLHPRSSIGIVSISSLTPNTQEAVLFIPVL